MNLDGRTRSRLGTAANRLSRWLAVLFPFSIVGGVFGQSYLAPPPGFQGAPAVPAMGNVTPTTGPIDSQVHSQTINQLDAQMSGQANGQATGEPTAQPNGQTTPQIAGKPFGGKESEAGTPPLSAPLESLMQWGALHLRGRASYQFLYSTGIHTGPGKSADTFTHSLTPGVTIQIGPHVTLDYSPSVRFYSEKNFHDTLDQAARLVASFGYGDWTFGISQNFTATDDPLVQTSSQTESKAYSAGAVAAYQVNEKVSLETGADISFTFLGSSTNVFVGNGPNAGPEPLTDSRAYSGTETLNYKFNEKVTASGSATLTYAQQSVGFTSVDETFRGNLYWQPGEKITASLGAGFEHRQFLGSQGSGAWSPIYSASVGYQLFEPTTISLFALRSTGTSLFENQAIEFTNVGLGLQQRLLGKLNLSVGFGYTRSDYETTTANLTTSRSDNGTSYSVGLSADLLEHCNVGTFYTYSLNSSSVNGFGYSSSQLGLTLSWAY